jgi:hypothetical protein
MDREDEEEKEREREMNASVSTCASRPDDQFPLTTTV